MELSLSLSSAVPVTASTTGDTIDITLPPGGLALDASTEGGQIRATDVRSPSPPKVTSNAHPSSFAAAARS